MAFLGGVALSYERGNPVTIRVRGGPLNRSVGGGGVASHGGFVGVNKGLLSLVLLSMNSWGLMSIGMRQLVMIVS